MRICVYAYVYITLKEAGRSCAFFFSLRGAPLRCLPCAQLYHSFLLFCNRYITPPSPFPTLSASVCVCVPTRGFYEVETFSTPKGGTNG